MKIGTAEMFDEQLEKAGGKLVVVNFYANWCRPCRMINPRYDNISKEFPNAIFLKLNVGNIEEIADRYKVTITPTFVLFRNGKNMETLFGAAEQQLRNLIIKHY